MKLRDVTRRAGRSLKNAKARTLLTSLAIGVGAFTITLSLAAGEGGKQYAEDIVSSNTNVRELYVQPKDAHATDPSKPREYTEGPSMSFGGGFSQKMLSRDDLKKLKDIEYVSEVTPIYNASAKYITREGQKRYQAGIDVYNSAIKLDVVAGSTENLRDDQIILPSSFAEVLGWSNAHEVIGKSVDIVMANTATGETKTFTLRVAAVTKGSSMAASVNSSLLTTRSTVADMYTFSYRGTPLQDAFLGATVLVNDEANVESVKSAIQSKGFMAQSAKDLMSFIFQFINVLQGILIGFGALAVLTSIFGIINTQYISVLERTQQIGLMKALGMRRRDVGRLFKLEAAWIGFLGGALGSGLALAAGTAANPWIRQTLTLGDDTNLLIFQPWTFVVVIVGLMIVSVGAGILPARKAAKLDPIEALRTE